MTRKRPLSCSVILCTRNRPDDVVQFLRSLQAQTWLPNQLVVIDSSDVSLEYHPPFKHTIDELIQSGVICVYAQTHAGLTYQRNQGIVRATGAVFYFFDDDVILEPEYLAHMQRIFTDNPSYAGGMGTITNNTYVPSHIESFIKRLFLLPRLHTSGRFTMSGMPLHPYCATEFTNVEVLGGCCMAYRRAVFARARFDEKLERYAYMEDVDMSYRVSRYAPLFYTPLARLQHRESPISRDSLEDNRAMFIRHYSYLFFKNFYPHARWRIICYWWSLVGLFVHALFLRNRLFVKGYVQGLRHYRQMRTPTA